MPLAHGKSSTHSRCVKKRRVRSACGTTRNTRQLSISRTPHGQNCHRDVQQGSIDEGRLSYGSWTVYPDQERWWDPVPLRHGKGTTFSFADNHAEYRKWTDQRTIDIGWKEVDSWSGGGYHEVHTDNEDLRWVQRGVWGKLGY